MKNIACIKVGLARRNLTIAQFEASRVFEFCHKP